MDDDDIIDIDANGDTAVDKETLEAELLVIDKEIVDITNKIRKYEEKRRSLKHRAEVVRERIQKVECDALLEQDWERRQFSWSEELTTASQDIFKLPGYRADQLAVMNASMSGDVRILITILISDWLTQ